MMRNTKNILYLVGDIYMTSNPHFFYQEVIYFPAKKSEVAVSPFIKLSEIFIDQIDLKLLEEHSDEKLTESSACFFFKN
ncbi:MAG TPA: hypothetical protein PL017_08225 [Tenuifilaceae bacterium]|nr:hypothetical protein [Tenuifilaceae bacterium]HPE18773.1 hypothetical protein [Tenuifilaceae bacterium]HPJ46069.1 hypothetical protein [Tenuifilaceae bacterium]HPQ34233.1 hypothetical protein [Tenuifilaceae bacterium]HRX68827.1 hypothetical protein [Tenuifilaceae bacterium]